MAEYKRAHWKDEIAYFDSVAAEREIRPLDRRIVERYSRPNGPRSIDFMFRVAGELRGKRVLEIGAGTGENALVLAALGAHVTALDISPVSLDVLSRRAVVTGVAERVQTVASAFEEYQPNQRFDLVWVDAFLHHVIPNLSIVLDQLANTVADGGRIVMSEPTSPRWLRRIRLRLPIPTDGTPGERPLEPGELKMIRARFPTLNIRYFAALSRFERFLPAPAQSLARADRVLLRLPLVKHLGGVAVMWTR
jgi:2-polyprenyl-3-methyl-5-hydroxy-6-metoxy-1,4-benzoquinol methylase